jgi:hypothetical protein
MTAALSITLQGIGHGAHTPACRTIAAMWDEQAEVHDDSDELRKLSAGLLLAHAEVIVMLEQARVIIEDFRREVTDG